MKKQNIILLVILVICLQACQSAPAIQDTPTPEPVPTPTFVPTKYGTADLDVVYCTPEGLQQKMDVYYPQSGGPWPALIFVHGGSWSEGDKAEGESWRRLNASGYLVVSINYRLLGQGKFPVMIEDLKCAVRFLRTHSAEYNLDPARIGAIGPSAGGHLVALLGTADESAGWDIGEYSDQSSQIQAVVCLFGAYDFTVDAGPGLNSMSYTLFGSLGGQETPETLAGSPVTYIDEDDPPFLLLHGDQDGAIPVEQAEIMHARLTELGVPSTLVIVENGNHGLQPVRGDATSPTEEEIDQIIFDFLEENLKSE